MEDEILYQPVNVTDTFQVELPISENVTRETIDNHTVIISCRNITISSFNTAGTGLDDLLIDGTEFAAKREAYKIGAEQILISNHTVWHNAKDNYYMAYFSSNESHDNVMIVCNDNETMAHIIDSINMG